MNPFKLKSCKILKTICRSEKTLTKNIYSKNHDKFYNKFFFLKENLNKMSQLIKISSIIVHPN